MASLLWNAQIKQGEKSLTIFNLQRTDNIGTIIY